MNKDSQKVVLLDKTPEGITFITINRPHRRNAVNSLTAQELARAFVSFENDAFQKVCVFSGAEGTFCAGFDLQDFAGGANGEAQNLDNFIGAKNELGGRLMGPMGPSRMMIKKPVICAVSGVACAGGLELSLIADVRVVEEDAIFGVFCRRFGVPLIDGGTVRLPSIIGLGRAMDMILTGRAVRSKEALEFGLANRVVPKGKAVEEATKLARSLLAFPQECMNVDRRSAYYAAYDAKSLDDALTNELKGGSNVAATEAAEGAKRFSSGAGRHGSFKL